MVRIGVSAYLQIQPDMEVIGEAVNGQEAVEKALELRPDVILMDLVMPKMGGLEATRIINKDNPQIKIIALTGLYGESKKEEILRAGASFFFSKYKLPIEELIKEIKTPKIYS